MVEKEHSLQVDSREYGYRTEPMIWSDLVQIIDKEKNLAKLSRSVEEQKAYMVYRRELLKEWKSVYDHILVDKFHFEKQRLPTNELSLWEAFPPLEKVTQVRKVLCLNDFPYYFDHSIEHWCLWKLCENVSEQDIEHAKLDLIKMHGDSDIQVVDFISWRNPPHLKSLPDIDHIHLLCLRKDQR